MTETVLQSFCERCGARYTFTEQDSKRESGLSKVGRSLGLKGTHRPHDEPTVSTALPTHDPFRGTFHFCLGCRQYTCASCWNADAGSCQSCHPLAEVAGPGEVGPFASPGDSLGVAAVAEGGQISAGAAWPSRDLDQAKPYKPPEGAATAPPDPPQSWPGASVPDVPAVDSDIAPTVPDPSQPGSDLAATDTDAPLRPGPDTPSGSPRSNGPPETTDAPGGSDDPWRDVRYSVGATAESLDQGVASAEADESALLPTSGGPATLADGWPESQAEAAPRIDPERWMQASSAAMGAGWLSREVRDDKPAEHPPETEGIPATALEWPQEPVMVEAVAVEAVAVEAVATPSVDADAVAGATVASDLPAESTAPEVAALEAPTPTVTTPSPTQPTAVVAVTPPGPPLDAPGMRRTIQPATGPFAAVSPLAPLPPPVAPLRPPVPRPTGQAPQTPSAAPYAAPHAVPSPLRPPPSPGPFAPPASPARLPPSPPATKAPSPVGVKAPGPKAAPTSSKARPCHKCALPLSAQARFCRRCGTPQA